LNASFSKNSENANLSLV